MSQRLCADCGGPLPVQSGKGRRRTFCERCSPPRRQKSVTPLPTIVPSVPQGNSCETATRESLDAVDRIDTPMGQAALALARAVDSGQESGSGLAAVVARLDATIASATSDVRAHGDAVDDLMARRRAKLA